MPLPDDYPGRGLAAEVGTADSPSRTIQTGYGRLGHWFWGFEQQGVVPDVVTVAKAMGNGYPLGAVVTSRAIAARFRDAGHFPPPPRQPVSSVVGLTVLDDQDEDCSQRSPWLAPEGRLDELAVRHQLIGAARSGPGRGVRRDETPEPATGETAAICDRMLVGVIIRAHQRPDVR
jgi:4-aminobutyrate aminotransferase-like enzyme